MKSKAREGESGRVGEGETEDKESEPKNAKASYAVNYPFGDFGRAELPKQPQAVAFSL